MVPLGIITAIIGAIRVGGPPQLKALIGRARENRASAELDFMSSTSHEVSELWNGHGIVRTMGKGEVKQILFLEGRGPPEKFGLFTLSDAEIEKLITRKGTMAKKDTEAVEKNRGELFVAAVLGIILQAGVIIFSAFVAYDNRFGAAVGGRPSAYAFPTLASGTAVLVFGMGICASVIGESTDESVWELKADGNVTTQQAEGNHQSKFRVPSEDVETGGTNDSYDYHKHLWRRILGVFTKISMKEDERMTKFSFKALKLNAKKGDSKSRKFLVFWLQQRFVVNGQTFDSYMLMAKREKELIMTSCRSNNHSGVNSSHSTFEDSFDKTRTSQMPAFQIQPSNTVFNRSARYSSFRSTISKARKPPLSSKQMPPYESASVWINTLCIVGTSTGVIGFVLQFEGFRGISWACSIAQLVVILVMTIVRAIIRRGILDRPIAQKIPEKYEIDWLALRIGNNDKYLSDLSGSTVQLSDKSFYHPSWKVCSQIDPPVQVTPGSMPITNESMVQEIVKIQKRIHELTVELETRQSESMKPRITNICAGRREIPVRIEPTTSDSKIPGFHEGPQGPRAAPETRVKECLQRLTTWEKPTASWDPAKNELMIQKSVSIRKRLQELTGWSDPVIKANAASAASAIETIMGLFKGWPGSTFHWLIDKKKPLSVSAEDIESILSLWMYNFSYNRQSGNRAQNSTDNIVRDIHSFQRVIGPSRSTLKRDMAWWAGIESAEALAEIDHNKVTKEAHSPKSSYYAMIAGVSKEKFLAQHIFSTFLRAIQMTKAVESTGLGKLEDANLLIIPPLSYSDKLPNEGMVDIVRKNAKDNELGYRDIACNLYGKLLKLCDDLPPEGNFVYKVVSTTVDFLVTATFASETKKYMETSNGNVEKSKRMLVDILRSNHKNCLDMLQSLYAKQGRLKNFGKAGLLDDKTKDKVKGLARNGQTILHREVIDKNKLVLDEGHMEQFLGAADMLGWTPLHYAVIYSLEAVQKLAEKRKELINKCDLAGRTPLHYAVMKQKDDLKQDKAEEIIKKLLDANTIPLQGGDGLFPLHWAVKTGNIEATKLLLKWKLREKTLNVKDYSDMTPLHFAALGGHSKIVKILLNKVVNAQDLNAQDRLGRTALHVAVKGINADGSSNRANIIEKPINKEASVAIKDKEDKKALNVAVEMEQKMKSSPPQRPDFSEELSHLVDVSDKILEGEHRDDPENSNGKIGVDEKAKKSKKAGKAEIPSKEEQLTSAIKSLLRKENLTVDSGDLLLWAVKNNLKTPFEFLIDWKEIAVDMS
ncbi:hypothetical protein BCON_0056g00370 [Botryotinia convoluta]|uniref:Uncharacterized protein n=1 Tax=Botryotinia convoluta TaxID=54673 RepID=A0A4Z1IAQ4_9HELO|nr:hypothetical protein BCON_0056g00370 [Botryotinia convoluta]